jgi:hypothetical protein
MRVPAGCSAFVPTPSFAQIVHFTIRHPSAALVLLVGIHGPGQAGMCEIGSSNFLRKRLL